MSLKRVLGTMLASRLAGRGGGRGGLGAAAMLATLAGGRRGGIGGKAGLAGLAYMAYQAYRAQQDRAANTAGTGDTKAGGIGGVLSELANRFGFGGDQSVTESDRELPTKQAEAAAERLSDEKALLLIRAMITAANSDGVITPDERARIMEQLDAAGADRDDRRVMERELANPKSVDELVAEVRDRESAEEVYLASRAAIDAKVEAKRRYLTSLRERLGLSDAEAKEIDGLVS